MIQEYTPFEGREEPDSHELQEIIRLRRDRLSRTIDQLGHELKPARLIERGLDESADVALEHLSHKTNKMLKTATEKLKRNPWPLLLVGAGILLWINSKDSSTETVDTNR